MNAFQVGVRTLAAIARDETVEADVRVRAAERLAALNEHGRGELEHVEIDTTVTVNVEVDRAALSRAVGVGRL